MSYHNVMNRISAPSSSSKAKRRLIWLGLLAILIIGLIVVITPIWIIQPFKAQTQRGLEVSYFMRRISPVVTIIASLIFIIVAVWLWRESRWFGKVFVVLLAFPLFAATWMSRQNHFEWMFRPHANVGFVRAPEVSFINDSDMVLAVKNNGEAAAYPVRLMAYHHVVHDTIGGVPIVATY
jgi:hypothetical protein